jgi:hypothetical protein
MISELRTACDTWLIPVNTKKKLENNLWGREEVSILVLLQSGQKNPLKIKVLKYSLFYIFCPRELRGYPELI